MQTVVVVVVMVVAPMAMVRMCDDDGHRCIFIRTVTDRTDSLSELGQGVNQKHPIQWLFFFLT